MKKASLLAISQGISELFYPHAEVVLHDLKTGQIAGIYNCMSKRKIGDESLVEELEGGSSPLPDVSPLYFKTNWDGRKMKSISICIRDQNDKPAYLLCINLDLSKWEEMHRFALEVLQPLGIQDKPEVLFKDDWKEKINIYVTDYLKKEGTTLKALPKEKKCELVHALYEEGAFQAKNAAAYVADVLDLSRATIYNYLRKKQGYASRCRSESNNGYP